MNKLITTDDWTLRCKITKPERPPDSFHLALETQLKTAKLPDEEQRQFGATFTRLELTKFRDVIDVHLAEFKEPEEIEGAPV